MATDGVGKWAVLIGIDFYKEPDHPGHPDRKPTNLSGCVADVTEVEKLLKTQYSIPPKHIFKLIAPVSKAPDSKALWLLASSGPSVPRRLLEKLHLRYPKSETIC
jgi:hypothetical protein